MGTIPAHDDNMSRAVDRRNLKAFKRTILSAPPRPLEKGKGRIAHLNTHGNHTGDGGIVKASAVGQMSVVSTGMV